MEEEDLSISVSIEQEKEISAKYRITRKGERTLQISWWTRNEVEDLYGQLTNILYKR